MAELELEKSKLSNNMLLDEAFRQHSDFDGFNKDFSDTGFKFLMRGIKETAPEFDLEPISVVILRSEQQVRTKILAPRAWWTST